MVDSYRDTDSSKHMVRKRLRNTDSSEHTEGNLEPQTKKKKVAAATKKTQTRKRTDQNTMRSTLDGVLKFLKEEKKSISTEHNAVLKKTLFYGFFKLCYEEKIIWQIRNKSCSSIRKILELYNAETSIAKIAGELIALTAEDVSLLFGFPAKGECIVPVARHECPDPNDPFIQRYFSTTPKSVTKRMIEDAVKSSLTEYKNNVADFPRLWILHTLVAFFFDNGAATIPWGYFTHIICLDNLETVSWAESVRKF